MPLPLRASDPDLRDLASGSPALVDVLGQDTGATLRRWLGSGGMATVFLATLHRSRSSGQLSPVSPEQVAIKFMKPAIQREAARVSLDGSDFFARETAALGRMMARRPPSEFVIGFFGSGRSLVEVSGEAMALPWLAIELVEGGPDGGTLTERVARGPGEGVDPVRALRLLRGVFEGVSALHSEGILHRDLKPDNVLVAGPVDDETPKLADYGIARIDGLAGTVAAMTPTYCGPEQMLSKPWERNPLVGPWTDVHALSAVAWFVLGGEHWCPGDGDSAWHAGFRRSLRAAPRLHPAFCSDTVLLDSIDAALMRGAAFRPPAAALARAGDYEKEAKRRFPNMYVGEERFSSCGELAAALLPLVERCASGWQNRCAVENRPSTALRRTERVPSSDSGRPLISVREVSSASEPAPETSLARTALAPGTVGGAVFQPDGKLLVRFGDRLFYYVDNRPLKVVIPPEHREAVAASRWLQRGPGGGFALLGPRHVLLIRGSRFSRMSFPERATGGEVGEIQAAIGMGGIFGVVTAETDDSNGGAELWTSSDGACWAPPVVLPLGGDVHAISYGPYGFLVVGSRRGTRGRALFLPFDGHSNVYTAGVNEGPPLYAAQCGAERQAWAAGAGIVLSFQRGVVAREAVEVDEAPATMALDLIGVPWLVTERAVLRRHVERGVARWEGYYRRDAGRPPLVAIGFTPEEAHVLDARGDLTHLRARRQGA